MSVVLDLVVDVFFEFLLVDSWFILDFLDGFVDDDLYGCVVDEVVWMSYPEVE